MFQFVLKKKTHQKTSHTFTNIIKIFKFPIIKINGVLSCKRSPKLKKSRFNNLFTIIKEIQLRI